MVECSGATMRSPSARSKQRSIVRATVGVAWAAGATSWREPRCTTFIAGTGTASPVQAAQGTHAGPMSGTRGRIEIRDRDTHPPVIGRATPKKSVRPAPRRSRTGAGGAALVSFARGGSSPERGPLVAEACPPRDRAPAAQARPPRHADPLGRHSAREQGYRDERLVGSTAALGGDAAGQKPVARDPVGAGVRGLAWRGG